MRGVVSKGQPLSQQHGKKSYFAKKTSTSFMYKPKLKSEV